MPNANSLVRLVRKVDLDKSYSQISRDASQNTSQALTCATRFDPHSSKLDGGPTVNYLPRLRQKRLRKVSAQTCLQALKAHDHRQADAQQVALVDEPGVEERQQVGDRNQFPQSVEDGHHAVEDWRQEGSHQRPPELLS